MTQPDYFEHIRSRAAHRWDQLEGDPELAGPWHQLFKQVQSPRHVVSELLQNADDARATRASVSIQGSDFVFAHNGEDFTEEHFGSLCRFGYSNKRALHTIGFRGIGFKSTFSLGSIVQLSTPTLSIAFDRQRFTEPRWCDSPRDTDGMTEVRVKIEDKFRLAELEKNLDEWEDSPASLLFFRSIRRLEITGRNVEWVTEGPGPIEGSEWMARAGTSLERYLLIRSDLEDFPAAALEEIRQERMVATDEEAALPPCRVEILLGASGRFYVVLPTGVSARLPFATNAPFVQDPARVKIKDPEISPTNRWLLERVGTLAARAIHSWVGRTDLSIEDRCEAYRLMPRVRRGTGDDRLVDSCREIVEAAFETTINDRGFILADNGSLVARGECVAVPQALFAVWPADLVARQFLDGERAPVSRHIPPKSLQILRDRGYINDLVRAAVMNILRSRALPKPETWRQLLKLWEYVADEVAGFKYAGARDDIQIIPAVGQKTLVSAANAVRLSEARAAAPDDVREFLGRYLEVVDPEWVEFLTTNRSGEGRSDPAGRAVYATGAQKLLELFGLEQASTSNRIVERIADQLFGTNLCSLDDCVQIAQFAASANASVPASFRYATASKQLVSVDHSVIVGGGGVVDEFLDEAWRDEHFLHRQYTERFEACSAQQWSEWVDSGRSGLRTFVPIETVQVRIRGQRALQQVVRERDYEGELKSRFKAENYAINDRDFVSHWDYWQTLAQSDPRFWSRLMTRLLERAEGYAPEAMSANLAQVAANGAQRVLTQGSIVSGWIIKFRSLPCLLDTTGQPRVPAELLRRTPATESLLNVEAFVRAELDTEATRPLLKALGVRETATGPDRVLDRLRALSGVANAPIGEVAKWYGILDDLFSKSSTKEADTILTAFRAEKLCLTADTDWVSASEVFLHADEQDVPGAAVLHAAVRHLSLWRRVGVADRPTAELAIAWLRRLRQGEALTPDELRRVRALLPRFPDRIWRECGTWLSLNGEWTPTDALTYSLTMSTLVPWSHLFAAIKQKTADMRGISEEESRLPCFALLQSLADCISERLEDEPRAAREAEVRPWFRALGAGLQRIILDDERETARIRRVAERLEMTSWQIADKVQVIPYVDGIPAGTARGVDVLWKDEVLYLEPRSNAQLAKAVAQAVGRFFASQDVLDAVKLCYERSPAFVSEYLEENFTLAPPIVPEVAEVAPEPVAAVEPVATTMPAEDSDRSMQTAGDDPALDADSPMDVSTRESDSSELSDPNDSELEADRIDESLESDPDTEELSEDEERTQSSAEEKKAAQPNVMERFAHENGYSKNGDGVYRHSDGRQLERVSGSPFPWELRSPDGELLRCYWAKDHCLERAPLQLAAELWTLSEQSPELYAFLLTGEDGDPCEVPASRLVSMHDEGRLTIHPATYRLVYRDD